jgi:hypothetical protein
MERHCPDSVASSGKPRSSRRGAIEMAQERFVNLLGQASIEIWGDMPRDVQEALFETAMRGRDGDREELARLLHDRHPRTQHPAKPRS